MFGCSEGGDAGERERTSYAVPRERKQLQSWISGVLLTALSSLLVAHSLSLWKGRYLRGTRAQQRLPLLLDGDHVDAVADCAAAADCAATDNVAADDGLTAEAPPDAAKRQFLN